MYRFIISENDRRLRQSFEQNIEWRELGFSLEKCHSRPSMGEAWLAAHPCEVFLIDITPYESDTASFMRRIRENYPALELVLLGDFYSFCHMREQFGKNSFNSLVKPVDESELIDLFLKLRQLLDEKKEKTALCQAQNQSESFVVERIKKYVGDNIGSDIGGTQIARRCNMNPSYMSRMFKLETGENLSDYIYRVRMEKAVTFMKTGKYSATQVSSMVGCSTLSYFSVLFKKYTGYSPSDYRKALIS